MILDDVELVLRGQIGSTLWLGLGLYHDYH